MNVSLASITTITSARPGLPSIASELQAPPTSVESVTLPENVSTSGKAGSGQVAEKLEDAVSTINAFLKPISNNLEFSIDEDSGKTVVKLVDTETKTILRQYPTKEALSIAKDIDRFQGLLINTEA